MPYTSVAERYEIFNALQNKTEQNRIDEIELNYLLTSIARSNRPLKCLRHASAKTMNRNAMWETCGKKFTCIYMHGKPV